MALQGSSNENSGSYERYVGLENFNVKQVNPEAPDTYLSKNRDGVDQVRIDFVLDNLPKEGEPHITGNISFFVANAEKTSKTGKVVYTNVYGQFAYLEDGGAIPDNMKWFSADGMRKAYDGEDLLIDFIRNYANVPKGGQVYLENPKALFTGNVSEVRGMINAFPNNKVKVLCTIREVAKDDGGTAYYQSFYNRKVERPYSTDFSYLRGDIDNWKANGGGTNVIIPEYPYILQKWHGVVPDEDEVPRDAPW